MNKIFNRKIYRERRKELRNKPTYAEKLLWDQLKNSQIKQCKFRRQTSIDNYIADFYCPQKQLVIELDGAGHFEKDQKEYDALRTAYFNALGLTEIRFRNEEVLYDTEGVIRKIEKLLDEI